MVEQVVLGVRAVHRLLLWLRRGVDIVAGTVLIHIICPLVEWNGTDKTFMLLLLFFRDQLYPDLKCSKRY